MAAIRDVRFRRMGYSGEDRYAEVEVVSDEFDKPLTATFKQGTDGNLELVNVTFVEESFSLDWFENNLHTANHSLQDELFAPPGGEAVRRKFAEDVLSYNNTKELLEDKFYYGE